MAKSNASFKLIRIYEHTHARLKVKAARQRKTIPEIVDKLSLEVVA
jgi:hypothetical protein